MSLAHIGFWRYEMMDDRTGLLALIAVIV